MTVYNENDPFAAQWLGNLVDGGMVAAGAVDERDIRELKPSDVSDHGQFHAFAGIGVWSHALRLAGWPDTAPVWTGSCPCQPFSQAGRRKGNADDRHLWPEWLRLITECRPATIFGEQVASPAGRDWLSAVRADLEALGYAVGAADLCAAGAGAPHLRQRLFWVANSDSERRNREHPHLLREAQGRVETGLPETAWDGEAGSVADTERGWVERDRHELGEKEGGVQSSPREQRLWPDTRDGGTVVPLADTNSEGLEGRLGDQRYTGQRLPIEGGMAHWRDSDWTECRDGKARPFEPGSFPLADGPSNRVGQLRAYGNAIVPQVAATFIRAFMAAALLFAATPALAEEVSPEVIAACESCFEEHPITEIKLKSCKKQRRSDLTYFEVVRKADSRLNSALQALIDSPPTDSFYESPSVWVSLGVGILIGALTVTLVR